MLNIYKLERFLDKAIEIKTENIALKETLITSEDDTINKEVINELMITIA